MSANKYQKAIERLGDFGELFVDYEGCPKGMMGRIGNSAIIEEVLAMPIIKDIEGNLWRPVNEEALQELISLYLEKVT